MKLHQFKLQHGQNVTTFSLILRAHNLHASTRTHTHTTNTHRTHKNATAVQNQKHVLRCNDPIKNGSQQHQPTKKKTRFYRKQQLTAHPLTTHPPRRRFHLFQNTTHNTDIASIWKQHNNRKTHTHTHTYIQQYVTPSHLVKNQSQKPKAKYEPYLMNVRVASRIDVNAALVPNLLRARRVEQRYQALLRQERTISWVNGSCMGKTKKGG